MSKFVDHCLYMAQFMPILVAGFFAAYGLTPVTRRLALHWNVVDQPSQRKIHREPIPLMGGLAILGAVLIALLFFATETFIREFGGVLVGCLWLSLVGYVDDRHGMNPRVKLGAQALAGIILIVTGIQVQLFNNPLLDYSLTLFWVIGIVNALNLMDNMDGLAAGITAIAAGTFFILAASQQLILVASLGAALCGATLGFLRYNFNPATTFMGDTGSLVIGFILAVLGIKLDFPSQSTLVTWAIPILVLAIPIFDTSLVTFTRLREKRSPFLGGKDHTSHRILRLVGSHRRTVVSLYGVAVLLGSLALIISQAELRIAQALIVIVGVAATVAFGLLEKSYMDSKS